MFINKITGFNFNSYNISFGEKRYDAKTTRATSKILDIGKERETLRKMNKLAYLLDFGVPKKVVFAYDDEWTFATLKLYNDKEKCFLTSEVSDEDVEACTDLFLEHGVPEENILYWDIVKGSKESKPPKKFVNPGEAVELSEFGAKEQAAIRKVVANSFRQDLEAPSLKGPVTFNDNEQKYKMSYGEFVSRTYGSNFDFYAVLDNLNAGTANSFKTKDIESIIVTPDGTMMEIRTKDGKRAFMDFNTGRRRAFDSDRDTSGYGTIMLMDDYGPVIREEEPKRSETPKRAPRRKAVNENPFPASGLLAYLGAGASKAGRYFGIL